MRIDPDPDRLVARPHRRERRTGPPRVRGRFGKEAAIGPDEPHLAAVVAMIAMERHAEALFVNRSMVPSAEQHQVVERGRAAVDPVTHVVGVAMSGLAVILAFAGT